MIYVKDTELTTCLLFGAINKPVARSHKSSASSFHIEGIFYCPIGCVCVCLYERWGLGQLILMYACCNASETHYARRVCCMSSAFLFGCCKVICIRNYASVRKDIFDNIEIQISISQQRVFFTSTALVLIIRLQQLSAVGGIYKINSIHLLRQK